jgi:DNA-binding response OmpR family regulator
VRMVDQDTPIIFLTAKSLKEDKIEGFRLGCDDYLTKPFSIEELLLRIRAVLRRSVKSPALDEQPYTFSFGSFVFDANRQTLTSGGTSYDLTPKESELLRLLCLHRNQVLEREVALREIWGDTGYFSGRSMDVFVSRLRKYLKDDPSVELMGIHGKGFKLIVS